MAQVSTDRRFGVISSSAIKVPVKAATTANITLSGEQTIDGISCVTDDRVLVQNQTTASENGIYTVDTGSWERAVDFNGTYDVVEGTIIPVNRGTVYGIRGRRITNTGTITIGTTSLTFGDTLYSSSSGIEFVQSGTAPSTQTVEEKLRHYVSDTDHALTANNTAAREALSVQVDHIVYDPVAPAFLKLLSDILNGESISAFRLISRTLHAGIKARTSTTDVGSDINDAIANSFTSGGEIVFPWGRFYLSTGLSIPDTVSDLALRGMGTGTQLFEPGNVVILTIDAPGISVEKMELKGTQDTGNRVNMINVMGAADGVDIERIVFRTASATCVLIGEGGARRIFVRNCRGYDFYEQFMDIVHGDVQVVVCESNYAKTSAGNPDLGSTEPVFFGIEPQTDGTMSQILIAKNIVDFSGITAADRNNTFGINCGKHAIPTTNFVLR